MNADKLAHFLRRGCNEALFSEKTGFSVKRGEAIQWIRGLVRISTGKAIQWRGLGHSLNRRALKTEKLLSSSPAQKSAPILSFFLVRIFGIIERGVPQAYVRARASSETLRSVHVSRVFICIFYIKMGIWYVSKRAWIHIWYVSKPVPLCDGT